MADPNPVLAWRTRLRLTQTVAAGKLGITRQWLSRLEHGAAPLSLQTRLAMERIAAGQKRRRQPNGTPAIALLAGLNRLGEAAIVDRGTLTPLAAEVAAVEGWGVFWTDTRGWEIQKLDTARVFADDDAALTHVTTQAAGSLLHRIALAIHQGDST